MKSEVFTIDCHFLGHEQLASANLLTSEDGCAFIDNNTAKAVPYLLKALEEHDLKPEDVKFIILTHIHLDHSGGTAELLKHCPNAKVICHPRAYRHIIDPTRLVQSATQVYGEEVFRRDYGFVEPISQDRVKSVEDNEELELGSLKLRFLHVRGHAKHHMAIYESTNNVVFSGDSFGLYHPVLQRDNRPIFAYPSASPPQFEPVEAIKALDRLVSTGAEAIYVTHFGGILGKDRIIAARDVLAEHIRKFASFGEEADKLGKKDVELQEYLEGRMHEFFREEFKIRGIDYDDVEKYKRCHDIVQIDVDLNAQGIRYRS